MTESELKTVPKCFPELGILGHKINHLLVMLIYCNADEKLVYSGPRTNYIANDLTPNTKYSFYLQASTEGDDSPASKNVTVVTPESGTSVYNPIEQSEIQANE